MNWKLYFHNVIDWVELKGYHVDAYSNDDCICNENKLIQINKKNSNIEKKTYRLLHEAGHILVYNSPGTLNLLPSKKRNEEFLTTEEKVRVLLEEIEAWKRGYKLGKKLNIPIDNVSWEIEQADALIKYMKWALE